MDWFWNLNLIHVLTFYLMLMFLISTHVRFRQYQSILGLVLRVPGRWPRLFKLVREHRTIFLTWSTVLPALLALGLVLLHTFACRLVWPQAKLTVAQLIEMRIAVVVVLLCGTAMIGFDVYSTCRVSELDRTMLEKYFDQAEFWLRPWVAPVVHVFTLGKVNPRQMVTVEVRTALEAASRLLNSTLWWVSTQIGLRLVFGLSLWVTYAVSRWST